MSALFAHTIDGWDSWSVVFQDRAAFLPLVRAICVREGLPPPDMLGALTPGTHAVFRAGDFVVKVFAPVEAGEDFRNAQDYFVERTMLKTAVRLGIPTSTLYAADVMQDRYLFRYIIIGYVDGRNAREVLPTLDAPFRQAFARRMRALCDTLHTDLPGLLPPMDLRERAVTNAGLDRLPVPLADDFRSRAAALTWAHPVLLHGDLNDDNVLLRPDGSPVIIDFADGAYGPEWYDLAPLVFELFHCAPDLVRAYRGDDDSEAFLHALLDAVSLHDFGADIVRAWAGREGIPLAEVRSLDVVGEWLQSHWH